MSCLAKGIARFQSEAGGMMELIVVRPPDAIDVMADALAGDSRAVCIMQAIEQAADAIRTAPRRLPMLCAACPRPLRGSGYSFGVALPDTDHPKHGLALAVCTRCATERRDIETKVTAALRRVFPDLRPVTVTHAAGGRA